MYDLGRRIVVCSHVSECSVVPMCVAVAVAVDILTSLYYPTMSYPLSSLMTIIDVGRSDMP